MLSLHQLRCFLATYEHGSLTGAADELGYAQPSVSEQIRSLAVAREPAETIAHAAVHEGMMRLREDGLEKVRRGLTSIAEIARVAGTR